MDRHAYHTLQILDHVEKTPLLTNRRVATKLDVSVKLAHALVKQLVQKGMLDIRKRPLFCTMLSRTFPGCRSKMWKSASGKGTAELVDGVTKLARYHLDRALLKDLTHSKIFISAEPQVWGADKIGRPPPNLERFTIFH